MSYEQIVSLPIHEIERRAKDGCTKCKSVLKFGLVSERKVMSDRLRECFETVPCVREIWGDKYYGTY